MNTNEAYVFLAEGFELIEAMTPVDVLRRAGMTVTTVSITSDKMVKSANGVSVKADMTLDPDKIKIGGWLILPGGLPGATNLYDCLPLRELLKKQYESEGMIASICASPAMVLGQLGYLKGRTAICYPGCEEYMHGATIADTGVTVDDKFVLGAGPALALPWSLKIAEVACGAEVAKQVADGMLVNRYK